MITVLALLIGIQTPDTLPLKYKPRPTTPAISAADLKSRLYIFADDSMMGRETGTRGHIISTNYIMREVRRLGLRPGGDSGSYFQKVPIVSRPFDPTHSMMSVDATRLTPAIDFVPQQFRGVARTFDGAQVIYGGTYGDTTSLPEPGQLEGKVVVFSAGGGGGGRGGFAPPAFTNRLSSAAAIFRVSGQRVSPNVVRSATWPTANMLLRAGTPNEA